MWDKINVRSSIRPLSIQNTTNGIYRDWHYYHLELISINIALFCFHGKYNNRCLDRHHQQFVEVGVHWTQIGLSCCSLLQENMSPFGLKNFIVTHTYAGFTVDEFRKGNINPNSHIRQFKWSRHHSLFRMAWSSVRKYIAHSLPYFNIFFLSCWR